MNKKKRGNKKTDLSFGNFKQRIAKLLANNPQQSFNYKQISKRLNLTERSERAIIPDVMRNMAKAGLIKEVGSGKYKAVEKRGYITGTVDMTRSGYGYVVSEDIEEDVFIAERYLRSALHGDKVKVLLFARRKGTRPEGEVVEVLERMRTTFVGTIEILPNFAFLVPDNKNMPFDLFVPINKLNGAKQGQKAVAKVVDWNPKSKNPVAEITKVLGYPGLHETEIHAILAEFELPYEFPEEVEKEAEKITGKITKTDIKERRDFRKVPTFTIDPADAKDFDDALSLQKLPNGNWEVGVHIADVTHYVKPGTLLESEAKERATSVYLVDRVVPMLPEKLSNDLCSLNQGMDKLTYSAIFEMDEKANVLSDWFGKTIINSDKRFSYAEAQQVIDTGDGDLKEEMLELNMLAQKLRKKRFSAGAISFDKVEVKFELDEKGKPLGIKFAEHGTANELIEEFMLLANRRVAEYIGKIMKKAPFVYRVHDRPDPDKIDNFSSFIAKLGYKLDSGKNGPLPKSINKILSSSAGTKEQNIIENLAMRAMAKAVYSTDNIGHYGLAFKHYTHFTSPIRRYPDMMVHRLLSTYLAGKTPEKKDFYEKQCEHSSKMERVAMEAERASIKYKQVEYMSENLGKTFEGVISGVTEWGIYVEITENLCEGMIHIRELGEDYFEYDEENHRIKGRVTGKVFTLGDAISIEVVKADINKKQLDFKLAQ